MRPGSVFLFLSLYEFKLTIGKKIEKSKLTSIIALLLLIRPTLILLVMV